MFKMPENYRITKGRFASSVRDGNNGQFIIKQRHLAHPRHSKDIIGLMCQASDGLGWEHVSVSVLKRNPKNNIQRLPNHYEMESVKNLFWSELDWVMELHPPKTEYVSNHPCLHLWKPIGTDFPVPPAFLVGIK